MQFTAQDHAILRNFVGINKSIIFKPGEYISTVSLLNTVFAKAKLSVAFERNVPIYDLSQFLSALSLFENPEIELQDKFLLIKSGKNRIKYFYADENLIKSPPENKGIVLNNPVVTFDLKVDDVLRLFKALGVISAPHITISGDGQTLMVSAENTEDRTSARFDIIVGETTETFKAIYSADSFKILPADYTVAIGKHGISQFKSNAVEYFVALDDKSTF